MKPKKNIFTSMLHLVNTFNSSWLYILEISIFYVLIIYAQLSISIDHIVSFLQFLRFDCILAYLSNANNHGRQCRRSLIIFYALWSVLSEFFLPLSLSTKTWFFLWWFSKHYYVDYSVNCCNQIDMALDSEISCNPSKDFTQITYLNHP